MLGHTACFDAPSPPFGGSCAPGTMYSIHKSTFMLATCMILCGTPSQTWFPFSSTGHFRSVLHFCSLAPVKNVQWRSELIATLLLSGLVDFNFLFNEARYYVHEWKFMIILCLLHLQEMHRLPVASFSTVSLAGRRKLREVPEIEQLHRMESESGTTIYLIHELSCMDHDQQEEIASALGIPYYMYRVQQFKPFNPWFWEDIFHWWLHGYPYPRQPPTWQTLIEIISEVDPELAHRLRDTILM